MIRLERHGGSRGRPVRPGLLAVAVVAATAAMMPAAAAAGTGRIQAGHGSAVTSWVISSVAGGVGPAGPATTAVAVDFPCGLALGAGRLYIADRGSVRKVTSTGHLTTPAGTGAGGPLLNGGPAAKAAVETCGLAIDHSGNMMIADAAHNQIRVVPASTGTFYGQAMTAGHIYGVAGTGAGGSPGTAARRPRPN